MNIAQSAKVIRFHQVGGPDVLKLETVEIPAPAPTEVRLRVKAIGVNRIDAVFRLGFFEKPVFPSRIGFEAAGVVESVGSEVKNVKVGDTVSVVPGFSNRDYGTYGELILVPAYTLQKHPETLSFEEAASLWTSYLAVYGMLVDRANLKAGQSVIINAASSGAGLAAIQMTNLLGGVSIALTTSETKKAALLKAGAQHVVVTGAGDFSSEVLALTGGKGANLILDGVGGAEFAKLVAVAAERAKIMAYGVLSRDPGTYPAAGVVFKMLTVEGYNMGDLLMDPVKTQAGIAFVKDGVRAGKLKPTVGKIFPLEDAAESHRYLDAHQHFGKVVLSVR